MRYKNFFYLLVLFFFTSCLLKSDVSHFQSTPGALEYKKELQARILVMKKTRGDKYIPRTKHILKNGNAKYTNRLFFESSPYLLQHAHNPVDWYPWSKEAFAAAKKLRRPVFLSVGYSTCHWCHVMEEESFEDLEIAKYLNENYICIKVDREERPDLDAIYMNALHSLGISGGWPMSVWLTENKKPFYGGTYFPARDGDRGSSRGFLTMIKVVKDAYEKQNSKIVKTSDDLSLIIKKNLTPMAGKGLPKKEVIQKAISHYKRRYDEVYGGLGSGTKFPSSLPISLLLRQYKESKDSKVLKMITHTLKKMARGGMYDQVGGGFHRYSTEKTWLIPHFEKMLYDNALLATNYLEAYQLTKNKEFLRINNEILDYIIRDMTSMEGAFFSATDADSNNHLGHSEEGYFFTWTKEDLTKILNKAEQRIINFYFNISKKGNFEGRHLFFAKISHDEAAAKLNISLEYFQSQLKSAKEKLYQFRKLRPAPLRDEKILLAWNALMISSFARSGSILNNKKYINVAKRAASFIFSSMYKNGKLSRISKDSISKKHAFLSDYSFMIKACLDLFEATGENIWFKKAKDLNGVLDNLFEDKDHGGYFMTSFDHEKLITKLKPSYDGAEPTGNSIASQNLIRIAGFTSNEVYLKKVRLLFKAFSNTLIKNPTSMATMLTALNSYYNTRYEMVIVSNDKKNGLEYKKVLNKYFIPDYILINTVQGKKYKELLKSIPMLEGKIAIDNKTTVYICKKGVCELPINDIKEFKTRIKILGI